jgi:glycosyltransferase involved in cell wall biosynthesis
MTDFLMFTPAYPPLVGGVEKHLYEVCRSLRDKGKTGKVVVLHAPPASGEISNDGNVIWLDPQPLLKCVPKTRWLRLGAQFIQIVSRHPDAILHFHDYGVLWPFLPILKKTGWRKRAFVTFHGWEGYYPLDSSVIARRQKCAALAVGNIAAGDFIPKWYGTPADAVIYGGIYPERFSNGIEAQSLPLSAAYLGRFEPDNGILEIVAAWRENDRAGKHKIPLHLFGSGSLEPQLAVWQNEGELDLKVSPPVSDVGAVLQNHPIIFASGYLSILEALCARRIVFAYFNNPLREEYLRLHPAAKSMFICGSAADVRAGLQELRESPATVYARMQDSWRWAQTQTWDRLAQTYLSLWQKSSAPC